MYFLPKLLLDDNYNNKIVFKENYQILILKHNSNFKMLMGKLPSLANLVDILIITQLLMANIQLPFPTTY